MKPYATFLLSTVAGLCLVGAAQAAPVQSSLPAAQSYADLLEPVQNADAVLLSDDHHHHHHHHHGFRFGFGFAAPRAYYGGDCYVRREVHINRWGERVVRRVRVCD